MKRQETNNVPQGYKKTPVGIIPKDWEVKRLGEISLNKGEYGINAPAVPYSKNLPTYLRITDIDESGNFSKENLTSINNQNSSKFQLKKGDLVFARTGATVGKTYLYNSNDGDLVFAGFLIRYTLDTKKVLPYFIKLSTDTAKYWYWVKVISQRSGQPGINSNEYASLQLPIPSLPEQQKIAEILNLWDKAIEKQSELITQLELRKKGLMQQLLTGRKRLPGFDEKWKKCKLGDICKRIVTKNSVGNTNVMTISAQQGFIKQTDFFNKTIASESIDGYYLVKRNEFCYNKSYSNGYPMGAIKRLKESEKAVVTTLYICFKLSNNKNVDIDFLEQSFDFGILNRGLTKIANEGGRAHGLLNVTPSDFFNLELHLPNYKEQKTISDVLTTADCEINNERTKLEHLRTQKRGLMQQLLTGKIRVN